MRLDPKNIEFQQAFDWVNNTSENLYLTGHAGTGKTTFLQYLQENSQKKAVVVAPTGVAAVNAGGTTIHSFFQIKPDLYYPKGDNRLRYAAPSSDPDKTNIYNYFTYRKERREVIENLELLIIDEVSMVRADLMDVIDQLLQAFGRNGKGKPFGGKQVVFIGDPYQLPPVTRGDEWSILKRFYKSPYFFSSYGFKNANPRFIELRKNYRQGEDFTFTEVLSRIRHMKMTREDLRLLNGRTVKSEREIPREKYVRLMSHNTQVNKINQRELDALSGKSKVYDAEVSGIFPRKDFPTSAMLELKKDAQVIFVKNDRGEERRYFNGQLAKVVEMNDSSIKVMSDNKLIVVERETWSKIRYEWDEEQEKVKEIIEGEFKQFPLRLAWAITIHKSQGLTLDAVAMDLSRVFDHGQAYVALSRATSLKNLFLLNPIQPRMVRTNPIVINFENFMRGKKYIKDGRGAA